MVFSQNKRSFADDGPYQFACKESCQVDCRSQVASLVDIPLFHDIPEKPHIADEETEEDFSQSQGEDSPLGGSTCETSVIAQQNPESRKRQSQCISDLGRFCGFRSVTSTIDENVGRSEDMKRPPVMDGLPQHPYKRARQADFCEWQASFEFSPLRSAPVEPFLSVAACKGSRDNIDAFHGEPSRNATASTSSLSWVSRNTSEEEHRSELLMPIYSSPCSAVDKGQSSRLIPLEDVYFTMLDFYPRKHVAVGPDHQADIPVCSPQYIKKSANELGPGVYLHHMTNVDNEKFLGTCIIPMPDVAAVSLDNDIAHASRSGCSCPDEGSIRCVRQHVMEAREKLKKTFGLAGFAEMGFYDMGEYVAQKWTREEERTFLEVVSANPTSLGKNFWDHLSRFFPSKNSKELVSYYFNVFMLRKRAEQNRLDPLNIDSDNDEWQESDDGEVATEDYGSDSVVETPGDQDDAYDNDSHEEDYFHEDDEDGERDDFIAAEGHREELDLSKRQIQPKSSYLPRIPHSQAMALHAVEDHDIQDDSCTSYEGPHIGANSAGDPAGEYSGLGKDHHRDVSLSSVMDPGCIVSPDAKAWDRSYFSGRERSVEFLPTCHVIEEVFGKGSWADESENGQRIS